MTKKLLAALLIAAFMSSIFVSKINASSEDAAASAINQTEEILASAYEAVVEVEQFGYTVSGLLDQLNMAGEHLTNACVSFNNGDFDNATTLATISQGIGEKVREDASRVGNEAYGVWVTDLFVKIVGSIIGVISVAFLSFMTWIAFKRRYRRRILKLKPEVISDES